VGLYSCFCCRLVGVGFVLSDLLQLWCCNLASRWLLVGGQGRDCVKGFITSADRGDGMCMCRGTRVASICTPALTPPASKHQPPPQSQSLQPTTLTLINHGITHTAHARKWTPPQHQLTTTATEASGNSLLTPPPNANMNSRATKLQRFHSHTHPSQTTQSPPPPTKPEPR